MLYTGICITEEPSAVIPLARICVGTAQVTGRSTTTASKKQYQFKCGDIDMSLEFFIAFLSTVLVFMITPGPSHLLMLSNSIQNGFKK